MFFICQIYYKKGESNKKQRGQHAFYIFVFLKLRFYKFRIGQFVRK